VFDDRPEGVADPADRVRDARKGRPLQIVVDIESTEDAADDVTDEPTDGEPDAEDDGRHNDIRNGRDHTRQYVAADRELELLKREEQREDDDDVLDELAESARKGLIGVALGFERRPRNEL